MKKTIDCFENSKSMTIKRLQSEAKLFLTSFNLVLNGISILPKEIEVYYYEETGNFKDSSVHRNELQKNNKNHFYVHRNGLTKIDSYKGGYRAGLDFVVSDNENIYHSYLIRSAVIKDGKTIVGPYKVLKAIQNACGFSSYDELETKTVELVVNDVSNDVLFSKRINLGENAKEYIDCELRAVLCDDLFKESKYPSKEELIVNFLQNKPKEYALKYVKEKLGYIPSSIRNNLIEKQQESITMSKPIIYISEWLRKTTKTKMIANAIFAALDKLQIEHEELNSTKDIWCRDYMPVRISDDGTYATYTYRPDYLDENKTMQKYITEQKMACEGLNLYAPNNMDIILDGGNYVRCSDKVIMTDKIFSENPLWKPLDLLQHLSEVLQAEIVLLPWDMEDPYGHADGMVAYLGDNKILLNGYWRNNDSQFHKRILKILKGHFEVIELPAWDEEKNSWCYINYLQVPGGILLPCLSENADCKTDIAAKETFKKLFPHLEIIPIYAMPLIDNGGDNDGGALHCVTWEFYEKQADK